MIAEAIGLVASILSLIYKPKPVLLCVLVSSYLVLTISPALKLISLLASKLAPPISKALFALILIFEPLIVFETWESSSLIFSVLEKFQTRPLQFLKDQILPHLV